MGMEEPRSEVNMEVLESSWLSSRSGGWDQDAAQRQGSRISSWDLEPSGFMMGLAVGGCLGEGAREDSQLSSAEGFPGGHRSLEIRGNSDSGKEE